MQHPIQRVGTDLVLRLGMRMWVLVAVVAGLCLGGCGDESEPGVPMTPGEDAGNGFNATPPEGTTDPGVDPGVTPGDPGDPGDPSDPDDPPPPVDTGNDDTGEDPGSEDPVLPPTQHTYKCTAVGSADSDGFFALRAFNGKLYAGQFGYGKENQSMLYSYPAWQKVQPGLLGISESVCAMVEFNGLLYANTESSGDIMRSSDGANWQIVHNGENGSIGCGLEVFDGQLYAVNYRNSQKDHGAILRSADGAAWTTVWDSGPASSYIREITSHDGTLYAFYVDESSGQGHILTSQDGTGWSDAVAPARFFRGYSWQGSLWASSTEKYSNGIAGVWRFDGQNPVLVHQSNKRYVTEFTHWDSALWAATSNGWKEDKGKSSLLMSPDGVEWKTVCNFDEIAAWSITTYNNKLYVGTWQYGHGGNVYEVSIDTSQPADPDPDPGDPDPNPNPTGCAGIAANANFEVCESSATHCAGVFTNGAGCAAYCAASGLKCTARFGGEPGCQKEPDKPHACDVNNGHQSDWCICGTPGADPGPDPDPDPDPPPAEVDCSKITKANSAWEVCETSATHCGGVFNNSSGCTAYCAAAGLVCTARYGGEPGCSKELQNVWACDADNGHKSDYCVCGQPSGNPGGGGNLDCDTVAGNPPVLKEKGFKKAVYTKRHNWVLGCYPNAYTAGADEHKKCDPEYNPDGSRKGKATYTFKNVAPGAYDVYVGGRHTNNRNPSGALFKVNGKAKTINQKDSSGDYIWDYHGQHCLSGEVKVVLDSSVNSGSDSTFGARLVPAP